MNGILLSESQGCSASWALRETLAEAALAEKQALRSAQKSLARSARPQGWGGDSLAQDDFTVETEAHSSLSRKKLFSCIKRLKSDEKANGFNLPCISHLGLHHTQTD